MKLKHLLLLISFWLMAAKGESQTLLQTMAKADSLAALGNNDSAISLYNRVAFFGDDAIKEIVYSKAAQCHLAAQQYKEAANCYELASRLQQNDSAKTKAILNKASCLLLNGDYGFALADLYSIKDSIAPSLLKSKLFYQGIACFGIGKFEESEKYFIASIHNAPDSIKQKIHQLFMENKRIHLSPNLARVLSIILPGAGQLYAGDFKNGLSSLLVVGGFTALAINTAIVYSIPIAALATGSWTLRYYAGGFQRATTITQKRINKRRQKIYLEVLGVVGG
ncbi:MAG: tetratricopeptide repeat protein [Bacteroidetes bacterium]|nr:tetratricopeptide repeat protein [Bacteroidota bacterium]